MKRNLVVTALITLALVTIGLILAGVATSASVTALPPKCSATRKTNCLLYINKSGRPVPSTLSASVNDACLLTINNNGTGSAQGLNVSSNYRGVLGTGNTYGTVGSSNSGTGLFGTTISGTAVHADSAGSGLALKVESYSGDNLIMAYDGSAGIPKLRFSVTRSGLLMVGKLSSAPATCDSSIEGAIYYDTTDHAFYGCDGSDWHPL